MKPILAMKHLIAAGMVLMAMGCTRSIEVAYQTPLVRPLETAQRARIGIAKFDDRRSWVDAANPKSGSFIAQQGSWRFGLSFNQKDYTPVADVIQQILLTEFANGGVSVKEVTRAVSKGDGKDRPQSEERKQFDYLLGGEILVFEFVNEVGFWTITSRRAATISVILVRTEDGAHVADKVFNESEREGEGMAVLHSTNLDKLVNGVLKKVAGQIVQEVSSKLGIDPKNVAIRSTYDGPEHESAVGTSGTRAVRSRSGFSPHCLPDQ